MFEQFFNYLLEILFGAIAALLVPRIMRLIRDWSERINLQITAEQQAQLEYWVRLAIARAEEYAAQQLRRSNVAMTGQQKLNHAIAFVLDQVPDVSRREVEDLIHASLPLVGTGAAAAIQQGKATAS